MKKVRKLLKKKKYIKKLKKYRSAYPSKLKGVPRAKDPYSAAHLHWVRSADDFHHRDARSQMTASIVASRMAEERKMKTFKESAEHEEQHLYHVTHTHHVDSIKKNGLRPMGGPSNWVQAGTGERYGKGEVYTFTHHNDAKKWAMNMDWAHHQQLGSGNISIIHMKHPKDHPFEEDKNDPLEVMTRKGKALKTNKPISKEHIVGIHKFTADSLKEDVEIDDELIEAINDWTGEWFPTYESTESALNSQWIQKQNVRKNPKLKEDEDKEEESEKIGTKTLTVDQIAKKHGVDEKEIERQLEKGIKVEYEHTRSKEEAAEIARDHLDEFPDYYDRLDKMEKKAKKDMKEWEEIPISHPEDSRMTGVKEEASMSVGAGVVAGMPAADPPDLTPVGLGGNWKQKRKKKFAGRTVFTVDPGTYWKAYLGKRKYEHYEKYLDGCDIAEEIRQYGRKYWDEPIILQNEQTGAMIYLKYGSK
jgi:hypothetical protein